MSTFITLVADLHCGSSFGLMPPVVEVPDGQTIHANSYQQFLYDSWIDTVSTIDNPLRVLPFAKAIERKLLFVLGDLTEGKHHHNVDTISDRLDVHEQIAYELLSLAEPHVDGMVFVSGTAVHVGPGSSSEYRLARLFPKAIRDPETHSLVWPYVQKSIDGVRVDMAHHTYGTRREHTKTTPIRTAVVQTMIKCSARGEPIPDLLFRAHIHKLTGTGPSYPVEGYTLPSFCWLGHFVNSIAPEERVADVGAIHVYLDNGHYLVKPKTYQLPHRDAWGEL